MGLCIFYDRRTLTIGQVTYYLLTLRSNDQLQYTKSGLFRLHFFHAIRRPLIIIFISVWKQTISGLRLGLVNNTGCRGQVKCPKEKHESCNVFESTACFGVTMPEKHDIHYIRSKIEVKMLLPIKRPRKNTPHITETDKVKLLCYLCCIMHWSCVTLHKKQVTFNREQRKLYLSVWGCFMKYIIPKLPQCLGFSQYHLKAENL